MPSFVQNGVANPSNWYHLGLLRLGTAHGYLPSFPIDATNQVIPCPAGVTEVGYQIKSGGTITIEERTETLVQAVATNFALPSEPDIVSTASLLALSGAMATIVPARTAGSAYTANHAYLVPFIIQQSHTFSNMFIYCATGGGSNHVDLGVYDNTFHRQCSTGSTVNPTGTAGIIPLSSSPITLSPGQYYFAFAVDSATPGYIALSTAVADWWLLGVKEMSAAFPLPSTITPAIPSTSGTIPIFGFSSKASI
jgi:hypothetical protein